MKDANIVHVGKGAIVGGAIVGGAIVGEMIVGGAIVGGAIVGGAIVGGAIVGKLRALTNREKDVDKREKDVDKREEDVDKREQELFWATDYNSDLTKEKCLQYATEKTDANGIWSFAKNAWSGINNLSIDATKQQLIAALNECESDRYDLVERLKVAMFTNLAVQFATNNPA